MVIQHRICLSLIPLAMVTGCASSRAVETDRHIELARQAKATHSIVRSDEHGKVYMALPSQFGVITYEFGSASKRQDVCIVRGLQKAYYLAADNPTASNKKRIVGAFLSSDPARCDLRDNLLVELDAELLSSAAPITKKVNLLYGCKEQNRCARLGIDESVLERFGEMAMFARVMRQGRTGYWVEMYDPSFTTVMRVSYSSLQSDMPASVGLGYVE